MEKVPPILLKRLHFDLWDTNFGDYISKLGSKSLAIDNN